MALAFLANMAMAAAQVIKDALVSMTYRCSSFSPFVAVAVPRLTTPHVSLFLF